ncbi:MAG: DNA-3-methyladenine glycosylase [Anaerolineales bacterium]|nr:DNA-3-methyladenine glycosylase [Anaerolineales bacterium]
MPGSDKLQRTFYTRETLIVARELLGQRLVSIQDGVRTSGIIFETEAYIGTGDMGCHARSGRTTRNEAMWGPAGFLYVYFTYGMHWMLNLVTEAEGFPAAVLLRAILPQEGLAEMRRRRKYKPDRILTNGPAKLCQALDIDGQLNGLDSTQADSPVFIERMPVVENQFISTGARIGLNSVPEPWKSIPWRFLYKPAASANLSSELSPSPAP